MMVTSKFNANTNANTKHKLRVGNEAHNIISIDMRYSRSLSTK